MTFMAVAVLSNNITYADAVSDKHSATQNKGLMRDVVFTKYTPLADWDQIISRLLSPLNGMRIRAKLDQTGNPSNRQSIDLSHERFTIYIPDLEPPQGFALLVFLPPWEDANVPLGWRAPLDQSGTVFVTMAQAGNNENVIDRRVPLVLLAVHNAIALYHVDPKRVYVGGFSGGSRVALRIALGYADVFRGVLLDAGSDPIGDSQAPLPPRELFNTLQELTRVVYVTGENDHMNLEKDASSKLSLRRWCVFNTESYAITGEGHDVMSASALQQGLRQLAKPNDRNPRILAACRLRIAEELSSQQAQFATYLAQRNLRTAKRKLDWIDTHFGGLAGPWIVRSAQALETQ